MQEVRDTELLRQYAHQNSEEAFEALVARHVNMVYSAALRKTGNPAAAEEITQAVFVILAKKANELSRHDALSGWLYQATRLTAANFLRTEIRRARREQEAYMQSLSNQTESELWPQIMPLLEDAMGQLGEKDRNALALRFFEGKSFQEIGTAFGASENAAKKRVAYALEKLRKFFTKHGVSSTTAIIAGAISANSVQAAPVALAKSVTAVAIAKGAAASGSTLTLIKGALKILAWSKVKTAITVGAVVLLAAGTTIVGVKKFEVSNIALDSWRIPRFAPNTVANAAPQVRILPTKFQEPVYGEMLSAPDKWAGVNVPLSDIVRIAYNWAPGRIWFPNEPTQHYDFASTLPQNNKAALRDQIKTQFNLTIYPAVMQTKAFVLKVQSPNAPGLKPHTFGQWSGSYDIHGHVVSKGLSISIDPPRQSFGFVRYLESVIHAPVIDKTGLDGTYDIDLRWNEGGEPEHAELKKALLDQLGLSFELSQEPVQMLVVEDLNRLVGIGVSLNLDTGGTLSVAKVFPDSPAAEAGLTNGVIIQKIDGAPVTEKNVQECAERIRGLEGTTVQLEILTADGKTNVLELIRRKITPPKQ